MKWNTWKVLFVTGSRSYDHCSRDFRTRPLSSSISGMARVQLNHAGASPSPVGVIQRTKRHIDLEQEIGGYAAATVVVSELESVYQSVADLIHAKSAREIALVESATVAWTRAFYAMAQEVDSRHSDSSDSVILISDAEYAANVVAASQWARDHGWTVLSIPSTRTSMIETNGSETKVSSGLVDLAALKDMLMGGYTFKGSDGEAIVLNPSKIAMVCITHVPTNSGIINPVEQIGMQITVYNSNQKEKHSIFYLVDACQSVGHLHVDVQDIQCHALVATGRKYLRGPRGTGFLYVASTVLASLMPNHIDHFGVPVTKVPETYQDGDSVQTMLDFKAREDARRFEFWESNVASRLGLGRAIKHAMEVSLNETQSRCMMLSGRLLQQLSEIRSINVHHRQTSRCGIVTFYSTIMDSANIKEKMLKEGYELSVVPATSTPLDSAVTKVPDLVRASLSYTNTESDIDHFVTALTSLLHSSR